jgi:membrane associated rhomboid family serine protease
MQFNRVAQCLIPSHTVQPELKKLLRSFIFPTLLVLSFWAIKFYEIYFTTDFVRYGVYPRAISGLKGIITSPFIHGDYKHLLGNSFPVLFLLSALIYFYKEVWYKVFLLIWLLGGFWLWLGGRESYHIGASGLVYGMAAFLFLSGLLRKHLGLMALSLLIVFLYGGLVWGIFPLFRDMSWEAHLYGACAGFLTAFVYRKVGEQRKMYDWELEEDTEEQNSTNSEQSELNTPNSEQNSPLKIVHQKETDITYHYKENEPRKN